MSDWQKPEKSNRGARAERRRHLRGDVDFMDWETKVIKRVERHVESLTVDPTVHVDAIEELGWEEASLLALRRRIQELKSG